MRIDRVVAWGCMLLAVKAGAQSWCPPGATWVYDTGSPWGSSTTQFAYAGDTLVDGFAAQRIERTLLVTEVWGVDTTILTFGPLVITHAGADVVHVWRPEEQVWDTLHWFSANVGDEWRPPWAFDEPCPAEHVLHVLEVSTMVVDGVELRTLLVERRQGGQAFGNPEWIAERIGPLSGYFFPIGDCGGAIECYCALGCYQDQDLRYPSIAQDCALPMALSHHQGPLPTLELWPNPGSGPINVGFDGQGISTARFLDPLGRSVLESGLNSGTTSIDVSSLPQGIYMILAVRADGTRSATKWIKQ